MKADPPPGDSRRWVPNSNWRKSWGISEITYPSRLMKRNSGGEIQRYQLDTTVRKETGGSRGGDRKGGSPVSDPKKLLPHAIS